MKKNMILGKAIKIEVKNSVSSNDDSVWGVAYKKLDKAVSPRIYNSVIHLQKESEVYEMYYTIWLSIKSRT
jgi:hypothetical protein